MHKVKNLDLENLSEFLKSQIEKAPVNTQQKNKAKKYIKEIEKQVYGAKKIDITRPCETCIGSLHPRTTIQKEIDLLPEQKKEEVKTDEKKEEVKPNKKSTSMKEYVLYCVVGAFVVAIVALILGYVFYGAMV